MNEKKNNKKKRKNKKVFVISIIIFSLIILSSISIIAYNLIPKDAEYVELLVTTTEGNLYNIPENEKTYEMKKEEMSGTSRQGYITEIRKYGSEYGRLELDPKRYAIVRIPYSEWNESWIEPEYNYSAPIYAPESKEIIGYEILTQRKYRLPLESFMTEEELEELKKIPYNDNSYRKPIIKNVTHIADKIELVDWNNLPEKLVLHGSAGNFSICPSGCDYASLATWEDSEDEVDLRGNGACIANIIGSWSEPDTAPIAISGWDTDIDDKIIITTDEGNKALKTGYQSDRYTLLGDGQLFVISEQFVDVYNIQINSSYVETLYSYIFDVTAITSDPNHILIDGIRITGDGAGYYHGIDIRDADANVSVSNVIIDGVHRYGLSVTANANVKFYNSVIHDISYSSGVYISAAAAVANVTNVAVFNTANDFDATSGNIEHCASDDGDGNNAVAPDGGDWDNEFSDSANGDFTILNTGNLYDGGLGINLDSYVPPLDIDEDSRSGDTCDIGADEYVSGVDTCTYDVGDWEIDCSDNCVISSNVIATDNKYNLTMVGSGHIILNANISNFSLYHISGGCKLTCETGCIKEQ